MQPKPSPLTATEYLNREQQSPVKHEFVDGEVYAMSGATRRHNLIAGNLLALTHAAARERDECQAFGSDMKVHVEMHNSFYYPDVSVCCDRNDRHELYLVRPCFIVEVLSPSTASIDRREKRASYTTIESLREYAIVDQDRMHVELHRRNAGGWQGYLLNQSEVAVESTGLGLRMALRQVYEGVEFPPQGAGSAAADYAGAGG